MNIPRCLAQADLCTAMLGPSGSAVTVTVRHGTDAAPVDVELCRSAAPGVAVAAGAVPQPMRKYRSTSPPPASAEPSFDSSLCNGSRTDDSGGGGRCGLGMKLHISLRRGLVTVIRIEPGGPAAVAGLAKGDEVLSLDGVPVRPLGLHHTRLSESLAVVVSPTAQPSRPPAHRCVRTIAHVPGQHQIVTVLGI